MDNTLEQQVDFLLEIDKLKTVERRTLLLDGSRYENSAEHSWHVAMCVTVLGQNEASEIDLDKVLRMLLVHDIVEIDAGDTFAYDAVGRLDQGIREETASRRLFGLLPAKQAQELASLWAEFDAQETAEARYANAIDRFMPILHNYHTEGAAWRKHGISHGQVLERAACIREGAPALWPFIKRLLEDAVDKRYLLP